jgi:hypothetical protein
MDILIYILVGGIILRTILDLTTLNRSSRLIDFLYTILYGVLGGVILYMDHTSIFGYIALMVAAAWAAHGVVRSRKSGQA